MYYVRFLSSWSGSAGGGGIRNKLPYYSFSIQTTVTPSAGLPNSWLEVANITSTSELPLQLADDILGNTHNIRDKVCVAIPIRLLNVHI